MSTVSLFLYTFLNSYPSSQMISLACMATLTDLVCVAILADHFISIGRSLDLLVCIATSIEPFVCIAILTDLLACVARSIDLLVCIETSIHFLVGIALSFLKKTPQDKNF